MTELRTRIKAVDPVPAPRPYSEHRARTLTRQILEAASPSVVARREGRRLPRRIAVACAIGIGLVGGGVAVASLGPPEEIATAHLLSPPVIVSGVGPQDVAVPEAPPGATYLGYELTCFGGTTCGTPGGSSDAPDDGRIHVARGQVPTTSEWDPENLQRVEPLTDSGMPIRVNPGTHWRLYAVYTDQLRFEVADLPNGKTLGIPGLLIPDYLPAVTDDGRPGWIRYDDLTYDADVELTPTGVRQEPLTVYAADGETAIGVADINDAAG
jgi:hypothetical protein